MNHLKKYHHTVILMYITGSLGVLTDTFTTQPNIQDGAFCGNSQWLSAVKYFRKKLLIDACLISSYASWSVKHET